MDAIQSNQALKWAGVICFGFALFQAVIGFSPGLSQYFGAPETLVKNNTVLIFVSLGISGVFALFGCVAFSGAGTIRRLPLLKPALVTISVAYLVRGLMLVPEFLVLTGVINAYIPVAPRFLFFSAGALLTGFIFSAGTFQTWHSLSNKPGLSKTYQG